MRFLCGRFMLLGMAAALALAATPPASADPEAICVPWVPSNQALAHYTYSGAETTLKGIARGDAVEYRWDFGDGGGTAWSPITDPYDLGEGHTYAGSVGELFVATLHVRDALDNESQDDYPVRIHESSDLGNPAHLQVRINMAIDEGLWWLHRTMARSTFAAGSPGYGEPYGYWTDPGGYNVAAVGTAVDAFQLHGSLANRDYDSDPYVETVRLGLNYLLYYTFSYDIGVQAAGDPDTNGNGIGLVINYTSVLNNTRQTYIGGICMVTLASSGAPNRVASVGRDNVYGRTYGEIVQDMSDFFAWGQVDSGSGRGGWRYYANYSGSDMSTTQWPPLGMLAAEVNMGATVPPFVRDELELYLDAMQNNALNNDNGGFRYDVSQALFNDTKTAAGIICHEFLGTPLTDPRVEKAIGFLYRHWNDTGTSWDYTQLHGNSYGMYGVMKAFRIPQPDILVVTEYDYNAGAQTANEFDWYYTPTGQTQQGLASYIVATQQADGSWDDTVGSNPVYDAMCTGWRVLILLKGVTIIPPVAEICDCDEQEYNLDQDIHLDGSCSFHPDLTRTIVEYAWDLDNDGEFDDGSGLDATIPGGFPAEGYYPVSLMVTDDNPAILGGAQTDVFECQVYVHPPPHCPHAFAGGPYLGWVGEPVSLDASASWDPDNAIASYDWDLDNDGLYGAEDDDCFGQPSDAVGVNPLWTWDAPYAGVIGLRVTDESGEFEACSDVDFTTVEIGNHAPVADPNGPYVALPGETIPLDGTGSFDIDPGDAITHAWDLDEDGEFDDAVGPTPDFTLGPVVGAVYDVCLKVTDSFGEYDIACTTVASAACVDLDDDGYGNPGSASCDHPEEDCDDGNPDVNPGADEVCDGVDNNCVEGVDEEPAASASCANGLFCDGVEVCAAGACEAGEDPCPDDGEFCNGAEGCDEDGDTCTHAGDPCLDGDECTEDTCNEVDDVCEYGCGASGPSDPCCENDICQGDPICVPGECSDVDGDGYGYPASPSCEHPEEDCDDDPSDDPPAYCQYCVCGPEGQFSPLHCGDWVCALCACCIHPGATEFPDDPVDTNCNGLDDCFIATAAFGSSMEGKLDLLRAFRDEYLVGHPVSRAVVHAYYRYSPPAADFIAERPWLRAMVRTLLLPVIGLVSLLV